MMQFVVGFIIGGTVGALAMAVCVAARGDDGE